jgi:hypothetical protein
MLTAVTCGLLCGCRGYESLVDWLHELPVDVHHWMGYLRRPPKKDCFRDLLMKLDPQALEAALRQWITQHLKLSDAPEALQAVSLDGKTLCGTLRSFTSAVHLLSAVDHQTGCVLSQSRVDDKTNEHKAALPLLKELVVAGRVIMGDAIFCQRDLCEQIVQDGGDYVVAVKENQPSLFRDITHEFAARDAAFSPLHAGRAAI